MFKTSINKNFDGATDKLPLVVSADWALSAHSAAVGLFTPILYVYIYLIYTHNNGKYKAYALI